MVKCEMRVSHAHAANFLKRRSSGAIGRCRLCLGTHFTIHTSHFAGTPRTSTRNPMSSVRTEFISTARLALPIAIGLAGHGLMTSLDSGFLGHHSTAALAACGLGVNVHLPLLLFGYGLVTGVSVLSAQGRGAGDFAAAPRALRAGLGLSLAYGVAIAAI